MHLASLHLEHFRGFRRLSLALDPTTVLIGENSCGKTSILDAIRLALSEEILLADPPLGPLDFHVATDGPATEAPPPLRIRLAFEELSPGEWPHAVVERLRGAIRPLGDGRHTVVLEIEATREDDPSTPQRATTKVAFLDPQQRPIDLDAPSVHRELRALKPVFQLGPNRPTWRGAIATGPRDGPLGRESGAGVVGAATPSSAGRRDVVAVAAPAQPATAVDATRLAQKLVELYAALLDPRVEIGRFEESLAEVGALLALDREEEAIVSRSPDRLIEVVRHRLATIMAGREIALAFGRHGAGTRAVLMFLLFASLLAGSGGRGLDPLAHPLLALEDPEAHLHPSLVAFIGRMLSGIRAQKLIVTHSGDVLADAALPTIRRLSRRGDEVRSWRLRRSSLTGDDLGKVSYHIQAKRGVVLFARCWLLVEGETEFWLLPALARELGYSLHLEGVECVEFAQCGIVPLVKLADDLGIEWHVLADGDRAGEVYEHTASEWLRGAARERRITALEAPDIEHCLWNNGFAPIYRRAARLAVRGDGRRRGEVAGMVIARAIKNTSKPHLARMAIEHVREAGPSGVPPPLRRAIETAVALARDAR
ncbi:MAG: DUF2813 domain-containing protein [Phycisphaerales bacterium]